MHAQRSVIPCGVERPIRTMENRLSEVRQRQQRCLAAAGSVSPRTGTRRASARAVTRCPAVAAARAPICPRTGRRRQAPSRGRSYRSGCGCALIAGGGCADSYQVGISNVDAVFEPDPLGNVATKEVLATDICACFRARMGSRSLDDVDRAPRKARSGWPGVIRTATPWPKPQFWLAVCEDCRFGGRAPGSSRDIGLCRASAGTVTGRLAAA